MRRTLTLLVACLTLGGVLGVTAPPAYARTLTMEQLSVELDVGADGVLRVVERLRVRFDGSWNGIFRAIPYADVRFLGARRSIALRIDAVEDDGGADLEYWQTKERGRVVLKIRVPGASDATREVVIRYRALNVLLAYTGAESSFGGHDELYWNVVGPEWEFPIEHVRCAVTLPAAVTALDPAEIRTRTFQGSYGSADGGPAFERLADGTYAFDSDLYLRPGQALTIAIAFPPGHIEHPGFGTRLLWFIQGNWFLLIPFAVLFAWIAIWWFWGRDALGRRTIIPEYEPPAGLGPTEVGVLLDESLDHRDVSAGIVDLAVRGLLTIGPGKESQRLDLDRKALATAELSATDRLLLTSLFGDDKDSVRLTALKHSFVARLAGLRDLVESKLVERGYWRTAPRTVRNHWTLLSVLAAAVVLLIGALFPGVYILAAVPCAIAMIFVARHMARRTGSGLDALARILGMQEYMRTAERERMEKIPLDIFEQLIPYAVVFGLHDRWVHAFAEIYERDPTWVRGESDGFILGRTLDGLSRDVSSNLYSGPRPPASNPRLLDGGFGGGWSGGSGFSGGGSGGGGSSGGGFGGGGGGGW
ncbi:MAG: DUF2207 domain-containing protein [Planctomycetota bacterium]|nr:DUF2207 domain-containing protein [Planctomycetota bacterium]